MSSKCIVNMRIARGRLRFNLHIHLQFIEVIEPIHILLEKKNYAPKVLNISVGQMTYLLKKNYLTQSYQLIEILLQNK